MILADRVDEDHDRAGAAGPLDSGLDAGVLELAHKSAPERVVTHASDEANRMPRGGRHRHVRRAATAREAHLGRVVGSAFQRRAAEDDEVGDEVSDDDEHQRAAASASAISAPSATLPR